jgi:prevent-host-death family protein
MRTASIRDLRHDLNRVLDWVNNGEEVAITKHRRTVARLLPAVSAKSAATSMPDITARLKKVFGNKVISQQAMKSLLDDSRGMF